MTTEQLRQEQIKYTPNFPEIHEVKINPWSMACETHDWCEVNSPFMDIFVKCADCGAPGILYQNGSLVWPTT